MGRMLTTLFIAMLAALAGAGVGALLGWAGGERLADRWGLTKFEGGRGFVVVRIMLWSGIAGALGAAIVALCMRGVTDPGAAMLYLLAALIGIIALGALGFGLYWLWPSRSARVADLQFEFELRTPAGQAWPTLSTLTVQLQTDRSVEVCKLRLPDAGTLAAQEPLTGSATLHLPSDSRALALKLAADHFQLFRLQLPDEPTAREFRSWSPWQPADAEETPVGAEPATLEAARFYLVRYRLGTSHDKT